MLAMCAIARKITARDDNSFAYTLWGAEHHVDCEIDLWPASDGTGPTGDYTDAGFEREVVVRKDVNRLKARFEDTGALLYAPPSDVVKPIGGLAA